MKCYNLRLKGIPGVVLSLHRRNGARYQTIGVPTDWFRTAVPKDGYLAVVLNEQTNRLELYPLDKERRVVSG